MDATTLEKVQHIHQQRFGHHKYGLYESTVRNSPCTHYVVAKILDLLEGKDPCDNLANIEVITRILQERLGGKILPDGTCQHASA